MTSGEPWRSYERLKKRVFRMWWMGLVMIGLFIVIPSRARSAVQVYLIVPAVAWSVVLAVQATRLNYWSCPQCARPFFLRFLLVRTDGNQCPHCGLKYGSNAASGAGEA